jgi:protein N-lysine methyltransferase METTL21D
MYLSRNTLELSLQFLQVYFPELLAPLLRTLLYVTASSSPASFSSRGAPSPVYPSSAPTIIIAYKIRSLAKETPFWQAFGLWFKFYPVLVKRPHIFALSSVPDQPHQVEESGGEGDHNDKEQEEEWHTSFTPVDQTFVFIANRRPESHAWRIPEDDSELLKGYGAQGTETAKVDDSFEALLLANLGN